MQRKTLTELQCRWNVSLNACNALVGPFFRELYWQGKKKIAPFRTIALLKRNIGVGYFQEFNITVEAGKCLPSNVGLYLQVLSINQNIDKKLEK